MFFFCLQSALCRSSQPLSGFSNKCAEDQILVKCIRLANSVNQLVYIVDTRPPLNALGNRAQGKGYENVNLYRDIIMRFIEIPNIHSVRSSLESLLKGRLYAFAGVLRVYVDCLEFGTFWYDSWSRYLLMFSPA